jgi:S-adenosylmethionine:tRNA ribosyltransferase-isomerase
VNLDLFDFDLPERLIAQEPLVERDHSRMMLVDRQTGRREHRRFTELPDILGARDFLVLNTSRVFPARLRARRPGRDEQIEVLLVRDLGSNDWLALLKPGRKAPVGQNLIIGDLYAEVVEVRGNGARVLRFPNSSDLMVHFEKLGEPPLPPYIERRKGQDLVFDRARYQTVYARQNGSVAAPTAGLHFTPEVLGRLDRKCVDRCEIMLHVGYGTFQPVRCADIEEHRMEPEYFEVTEQEAARIRGHLKSGHRLVAVGTTTTRVLEHLARSEDFLVRGGAGFCDLFIRPGFQFGAVSGLLTNFHLPRSTLLMLVCAFAGRELILDCYREAVANNYRFYSYGDCMLIL